MTPITIQDNKVVVRNGKVGTEQECCCQQCPCICPDCSGVTLSGEITLTWNTSGDPPAGFASWAAFFANQGLTTSGDAQWSLTPNSDCARAYYQLLGTGPYNGRVYVIAYLEFGLYGPEGECGFLLTLFSCQAPLSEETFYPVEPCVTDPPCPL